MKIKFLLVGKTSDKSLDKLIDDYMKRLTHYVGFEMIVVPELKDVKNRSVEEQKEREADLILKQLNSGDDVVLLDEKGKEYGSVDFSVLIGKKMLSSVKYTIFVVGGPYGFSKRVYDRADALLSLSKMTFSHQMIRLIFVEQLYRAMTILKNEPYHHE
ncbi:MAG: 23S rRNA (pseudouridine(1915)-N(3))-methyltransferase RlmH [Prevotellaceae bacterium]|nr:23S rRNA (pseudouridine(1915)-N(3))-methyltransferase RlmH [Prevotellaceae bacterium]